METDIAANTLIKRFVVVTAAALMATTTALAQGFETLDLSDLVPASVQIGGDEYLTKSGPKRLTLMCSDCAEFTAIDVLLSESRDGTEGRYRSGQTTLARMEEICRSSDDSCRLQALNVSGAIGWQSTYSRGSTSILFKDGDMLTIRAVAPTPAEAKRRNTAVLHGLGKNIIGR